MAITRNQLTSVIASCASNSSSSELFVYNINKTTAIQSLRSLCNFISGPSTVYAHAIAIYIMIFNTLVMYVHLYCIQFNNSVISLINMVHITVNCYRFTGTFSYA